MPPKTIDVQTYMALLRSDLRLYAAKIFSVVEPSAEYQINWHIDCICEHLMAVDRGQISRLIINIPPRTLKSVLVAQIYPTWIIGRNPAEQVICASYAHSLAERNAVAARDIVKSDVYGALFPYIKIKDDQNTKDYFKTTDNGHYKAVGIGGTVTGFGASTLIIDDPINPKEGNSATIRENAIREIRSTLFSRFNDIRTSKTILIMQRLHENDPTGNLLSDGNWTHLKLPAEAKTSVHIKINDKEWRMEKGDILTPRLPKAALEQMQIDLQGAYAGQYLQEPVPPEGNEIKSAWYQYYKTINSQRMNVYILVDAANSKRKGSDYTAMMVVGLNDDGNYYLLDIVRGHMNPTERIDKLFEIHRKWAAGKAVKVGYEKYGLMTDTFYIKAKQESENYRFPVIELGGRQSKEDRIRAIIPDLERGKWWFPETLMQGDKDLIKQLLFDEMAFFPLARHDDMLDAMARIKDEDLCTVFPRAQSSQAYKSIMMG
jgi:predicted phage terminase large subunit-like protein